MGDLEQVSRTGPTVAEPAVPEPEVAGGPIATDTVVSRLQDARKLPTQSLKVAYQVAKFANYRQIELVVRIRPTRTSQGRATDAESLQVGGSQIPPGARVRM